MFTEIIKNHFTIIWSETKKFHTDILLNICPRFIMKYRLLFLLILLELSYGQKYLKFYKTDCIFNPKYVANGTCSLRMKARGLAVANVDYDILIDMWNVSAHVVMYKYYNQFRPFLIDEKALLCKLITDISYMSGMNYFAKTVYRIVRKFSNAILFFVITRYIFCYRFNDILSARTLLFSGRRILLR